MRHDLYPPLYYASQQISSLNAKLSDLLLRMTKESENTKKALEKGEVVVMMMMMVMIVTTMMVVMMIDSDDGR